MIYAFFLFVPLVAIIVLGATGFTRVVALALVVLGAVISPDLPWTGVRHGIEHLMLVGTVFWLSVIGLVAARFLMKREAA